MSDAFLVLAQTDAGVGCFLVPRVLEDGERNPFALQRLKDKLGNRSNASSEVELDGTWGVRWATRVAASGPSSTWLPDPARLHPRVVGDHAGRAAEGDPPRPASQCVRRAARRPAAGRTSLPTWPSSRRRPRPWRFGSRTPWTRATPRSPASVEAYLDEVRLARGHHRSLDLAIDALPDVLPRATEPDAQAGAFRVVELLAITLQAALPAQYAPAVVADSFIASRLGGEHGVTLGTPNSGLSTAAAATLVHRAFAL